MALEDQVSALVQAANNLTGTVSGKMTEIDQRVEEAEQEYQGLIAGIRSDFPFYRLTKNQELKITDTLAVGTTGTPDGFHNRNPAYHICEIVANTASGTLPENKDPEVQAMFLDIKGSIPQYNQPNFAIVRVSTTLDAVDSSGQYYTIYQGPIPNGIPYTIGCLVKVESGEIGFARPGSGYKVTADGKWHEMLMRFNMTSGGTTYDYAPHIYVPPGASVLIALPAVVAGKVPDGKWGYFHKPVFESEA